MFDMVAKLLRFWIFILTKHRLFHLVSIFGFTLSAILSFDFRISIQILVVVTCEN